MSLRSRIVAGFILGALSVAPASAADPKSIDDSFRQVEQMSRLERDRLQRNLSEFNKLSPEQKAHYRDLHQKLEENKTTGGSLSSLLQEYSAWLTTLTPSQRDDLNRETDPARKLALVRRFKEEQEYRPEPTPPGPNEEPIADLRRMRQRMVPFAGPLLTRNELNAMMQIIAKDSNLDFEKAENESALRQYRDLIKSSIENTPGGPREWPSPGLQLKMEQAIERQDIRRMLNSKQDMKREYLVRLLMGSIVNQGFEEMKSTLPSEADLQKVLETLEQGQREEITRLPREEARRRLAMVYYKNRGDDSGRKLGEFQRQMQQMFELLGIPQRVPGPPGEGPRPGFGPGPFSPGQFGPRDGMPDRPEGGRPEGGRGGEPRNKGNGQDRPKRNSDE